MPSLGERDIHGPRLENLRSSVFPWPESVISLDPKLGSDGIIVPIVSEHIKPYFSDTWDSGSFMFQSLNPFGCWQQLENDELELQLTEFVGNAYMRQKRQDVATAIQAITVSLYPEKTIGMVHFCKAAGIDIKIAYNLGDGTAFLDTSTGLWEFNQRKGAYDYMSRFLVRRMKK